MDTTTRRWEPLAGVLFGVLLVTGGLLYSSVLPNPAPVSDVARHFQDASTRISIGGATVLLGAVPLLWFVACLRRRLLDDGDDGHLAALALVGGAVSATMMLTAGAILLGAADRTDYPESLPPAWATAAWDLSAGLLGTALPAAMAVMLGAAGVAARRSGWFAPSTGALTWVLVMGLLIPPLAWMFAIGAVLWVAAVSIAMALQPTEGEVLAPPPGAA